MRKVPIIVVSILFLSLLCPSAFADWQVTFDMGADTEVGNSVRQTRDGGYIVAGSLWGITPGGQVVLIKTDANGAEEWTKGFEMSHGPCVQQTRDDGYAIAGSTISVGAVSSDLYVVKTDADGNEQGSNSFGGPEHDYGQYIEETSDGGYIITGSTRSYGAGSKDVWLIKTDADYGEQWNRTFGGSDDDEGHYVQQTTDGGYIIAGTTRSFGAGSVDVWLIKTDSDGIKQRSVARTRPLVAPSSKPWTGASLFRELPDMKIAKLMHYLSRRIRSATWNGVRRLEMEIATMLCGVSKQMMAPTY